MKFMDVLKQLNEREANKPDISSNYSFYADWDENYGQYCVFGDNDGAVYRSFYDKQEAEDYAEYLNKKYKNKLKK